MSDKDEAISLKEAAELTREEWDEANRKYLELRATPAGRAEITRWLKTQHQGYKRAREVGNAGATLDVMLAASRRGKTVRGS